MKMNLEKIFLISIIVIQRKYETTREGYSTIRRKMDDVQKHTVDMMKFHKNLTIILRDLRHKLDKVGI